MDKILEELKKINSTSAPSVPQRDEWQDTVTEVKKIIEKKADKTLVSAEPCAFSPESTKLPGSRFYADINTAHLECFFHKGDLDYLVVFFSGSRSRGGKDLVPYPTFSSWSWYKEVNASILCIDDPMYHTFEQIACGWYYGTQTDDFRQDTAELIKKIADLLGVSQRHILLYGRSAGGTAAVAVSDFINGCCVCAVNAQFDIENYKRDLIQWYRKTGDISRMPLVDIFMHKKYWKNKPGFLSSQVWFKDMVDKLEKEGYTDNDIMDNLRTKENG